MSGRRLSDKQHSDDIDSLDKYTEMYMLDLYSYKGKYFEENISQGRQLERQENAVMVRNGVIFFIVITVLLLSGLAFVNYSKKKALYA